MRRDFCEECSIGRDKYRHISVDSTALRFVISQSDCRIKFTEVRFNTQSCLDDMTSLIMRVIRPLTVTIP